MIRIKVNATSANVSVGYDVLGLALALDNTFTFKEANEFSFTGFDETYTFENNMVYTSYLKVFDLANKEPVKVSFGFSGDIPICRGLGSSSSLIAAGVFGANYYLNNLYTKEELLDICAGIEGHPDNVAPAIFGGLVASYKNSLNKFKSIIHPVSKDLKFITIIPNDMVKTSEARKVLPSTLDYSSIVSNLSRIVNIPFAFKEGDLELLNELFVDKLHEPYRKLLIALYEEVKNIALKYKLPFFISGSGSTMIMITKNIIPIELKDYNYRVLEVGSGIRVEEIENE